MSDDPTQRLTDADRQEIMEVFNRLRRRGQLDVPEEEAGRLDLTVERLFIASQHAEEDLSEILEGIEDVESERADIEAEVGAAVRRVQSGQMEVDPAPEAG